MLVVGKISRLFGSFIFLMLLILSAQAADSWFDSLPIKISSRDSIKNNDSTNSTGFQNSLLNLLNYSQRTNKENAPAFNFVNSSNLINSLIKSVAQGKNVSSSVSDNQSLFSDQQTNKLSDCTTTPISFGQSVNETITTSDCTDGFRYYDQYAFTGTANQNIAVTMNSSDFDTSVQLYNSSNQRIAVRLGFPNAHLIFTIPSDGTYTIIATSGTKRTTGAYTISFTNNGICSLTVTAINFGETKSGALSTSDCVTTGEFNNFSYSDDYTFSGTSGQQIIITMSSDDFNEYLELYNSSNQLLRSQSGSPNAVLRYTLQANGTYRIRVRAAGSSTNQTGLYTLSLTDNGVCGSTPINFGQAINATISTDDCIGESIYGGTLYYDEYTFSGTAGQIIQIDMISTGFLFPFLELYNSSGQIIAYQEGFPNGVRLIFTLRETGTYKIRTSSEPGAYTIFLAEVGFCNLTPVPISFGQTVNGSILNTDCAEENFPGEIYHYDDYGFNGTAGQKITIAMSSNEIDPYFELYNSAGQFITFEIGSPTAALFFQLPQTGDYKIRARSLNNASGNKRTGAYTLTLTNNGICNPTPVPISFGQTIDNAISTEDCFDNKDRFFDGYTFQGRQGQTIRLTMNSTVFNPKLELYFPNGGKIGQISFPNARLEHKLTTTGTYEIRASYSPASQTPPAGAYSINLFSICQTKPINVGETIDGALSTTDCVTDKGYSDDYTFSGTAGQSISIKMNSTEFPSELELYDSRGKKIAFDSSSGNGANSQLNFLLQTTETYMIRATSSNFSSTGTYTLALSTANRTKYDFDGDGRTDISVFRPANSFWYLSQTQAGFSGVQFGISTDKLVPADYDGDGKSDIAVFRDNITNAGSQAYFYILLSSTGQFREVQFGQTGDTPVTADFDGDGKSDLAVYRNGDSANPQSYFLYRPSAGPSTDFVSVQWGLNGDKPVPADYDGDGKTDMAVFRPSNGVWYIQRSRDGFFAIQFGTSEDKTVVGDYDGDGKADQAVYRPSNNVWYLQASTTGFSAVQFGTKEDKPVAADYDGDGKTDVAVYRPSSGTWYLLQSRNGFAGVGFGMETDRPVPGAFVP